MTVFCFYASIHLLYPSQGFGESGPYHRTHIYICIYKCMHSLSTFEMKSDTLKSDIEITVLQLTVNEGKKFIVYLIVYTGDGNMTGIQAGNTVLFLKTLQ